MKKILFLLFAATLGLAATAVQANVRAVFGNFAPFSSNTSATAVDFVINGEVVRSNITYGQFTSGYVDLGPAGTYDIEIRPSGGSQGVGITANLPDGDYTVILIGDGDNQLTQGLAIQDLNSTAAGTAKLRFIHAASFAASVEGTSVSVRTEDNQVFAGLSDLEFGGFTDYAVVEPGSYDFRISSPDGSEVLVDPGAISLDAGDVVTLVITGDGDNQPLGVTAIPFGDVPAGTGPVDLTGIGIFYDPQTDGQGAQVMVFPQQRRILGFFYTYDTAGQQQVWYHFDSCNSDPGSATCDTPGAFDGISAPVTIYRAEGGIFNDPTPPDLFVVGTGEIRFEDCDNLTFTGNFGNGEGTVVLDYTRLGERLECSSALSE